MPQPNYQVTNFKIGIIKSQFEDQGYGFISGTNCELTSDIFFHYKNLLSQKVNDKNIVVFQTIDSTRHAGKLEAVKVVLLSDVIDFAKLLQLYLKYGFTDIFKQICTLNSEDIAKRNPEIFLPDVIEHELSSTSEKNELLKIRRFIKVLKSQTEIKPALVKQCFKTLLDINPLHVKDLYFDVYKILRNDPIISSLGIDTLELFGSLTDEQKKLHFEDLTLSQRLHFKNIGAVDSDDEFEDLLTIISATSEDAAFNWQIIKSDIILATKYIPLLWLKNVILDFPAVALKHHILDYGQEIHHRLFSKMTVDQLITVFPYRTINDNKSYEFLKTCLLYTTDPIQGLSAFLIAGLELEPLYYFQCIADEFVHLDDVQYEILIRAVTSSSNWYHQRLIAFVGWKSSLIVFAEEIEKEEYKTLRKILEFGGFAKADSGAFFRDIELMPETTFNLWDQGLTEFPPPEAIAKYFLQARNPVVAEDILKKTISYHEQIFSAAITLCRDDRFSQTEKYPLRLLKAIKNYLPALYNDAKHTIYDAANEWIRIYLWLYDHSAIFDFQQFAPYFGTLTAADQKRYIKKVFFDIHQNSSKVSLAEIINLKNYVIGPEVVRTAGEAGKGIDFTVFVILQALEDMSSKQITKPDVMYKIIGDQVRSPKELLVLDGFFDKCEGRLSIDEFEQEGEEKRYKLRSDRNEIPKDTIYCEGRKAIIKGTSTPAICEKTGLEFWWCRNGKCYGSCVTPNAEWKKYTLIDFLEIAHVDYIREDYEIFLGYVNKVNKFLKHMTCCSCAEILKPASAGNNGNYGFYRVGNLSCHNETCDKKGENIYLTHCINGFCSGVIDSRDSVKCRQSEEQSGNSGWYICNDCLACCTSEGIGRRKYVLNSTGQTYGGQALGHRDKGIICCPKCGNELNSELSSPEDYKRVLAWFIKNRASSNFIQNSGQRKDGKYWFVVQAPVWDTDKLKEFKKKLYKYSAIGFNVPDIHEEKDSYLVAEPFRDSPAGTTRVLSCPNGDYQLEVMSDYDRYFAMSKYHINVQLPSFKKT
jgi:cold shock CspA family protein